MCIKTFINHKLTFLSKIKEKSIVDNLHVGIESYIGLLKMLFFMAYQQDMCFTAFKLSKFHDT